MEKPTFRQQYDKITSAYLNNELEPYSTCACFIGNLLGSTRWADARTRDFLESKIKPDKHACDWLREVSCGMYTGEDITILEHNFLKIIDDNTIESGRIDGNYAFPRQRHPNYEEALYLAMVSTLDMLKNIHESKGENVDAPKLKKRVLQVV